MGSPETPRHLTGEEVSEVLGYGIESGQIALPSEEESSTYTSEEVAADLGIELPPADTRG